MRRSLSATGQRRGRPEKFGRPAELVQITLPTDVVRGLRQMNDDLARAVVQLFELAPASGLNSSLDVELLSIADRQFLIVINRSVVKALPGVDMIPIEGHRAFLALTPGRGVSDLELAVIDRLADANRVDVRERDALGHLREQLRVWHDDPALQFHDRAIIVVESTAVPRPASAPRAPLAVQQPDVEIMAFAEGRSLIIVNTTVVRSLTGVDIIPIGRARGFLALAPGRTASDLERAVAERRSATADAREQQALGQLRRELKTRRNRTSDQVLRARSIIVVEALTARRSESATASLRGQTSKGHAHAHARTATTARSWLRSPPGPFERPRHTSRPGQPPTREE